VSRGIHAAFAVTSNQRRNRKSAIYLVLSLEAAGGIEPPYGALQAPA
jgi:hypothetical protein